MEWKKLLPEGPFAFVSAIAVAYAMYEMLFVDTSGNFLAFLIFGAIGTYATKRLIDKFK